MNFSIFSSYHRSHTGKKTGRRTVLLLCCFLFLSSVNTGKVYAETREDRLVQNQAIPIDTNQIEDWPQGPVVSAEAAILMEAHTGTILYAKNIHKQEYPASCTKILTCLLAAELCSMDEMVVMSKEAIYDTPRNSNHIALDVGEEITMEQALNAILIRSANEVSFAVGEHISGSWQAFADLMNERAVQLGCLNSHFVNPNGLPDENHYTTAYDLATIARSFFANELLSKISRTTKLSIPATDKQPDNIIEYTKNKLLPGQSKAYTYLVGSKTGYTDAARNCLVSCAEKDGMKLICVVLKDENPVYYDDTIQLFDYGFANFREITVAQAESKYDIGTSAFYSGKDIFGTSKPLLSLNQEDFIVLPINAHFEDTQSSISYNTQSSRQAAVISYTYHGQAVGTASVDFTASENHYNFENSNADDLSGNEVSSGKEVSRNQTEIDGQEDSSTTDKGNGLVTILKRIGIALCIVMIPVLLLLLRNLYYDAPNRRRRKKRRAIGSSVASPELSLRKRRKEALRRARSRRRR